MMSVDAGNGTQSHTLDQMPFKLALPLVAVGTFIVALGCAFCCYLARLRKHRVKVGGYKKVTLNKGKENPLQDTKNDTCPVCLEDFKNKEVLAICPCAHVFHKKCLRKWLMQRPLCPMCMTQVSADCRQHHRTNRTLSGNRTVGSTSFSIPSMVGTSPALFPSHV